MVLPSMRLDGLRAAVTGAPFVVVSPHGNLTANNRLHTHVYAANGKLKRTE